MAKGGHNYAKKLICNVYCTHSVIELKKFKSKTRLCMFVCIQHEIEEYHEENKTENLHRDRGRGMTQTRYQHFKSNGSNETDSIQKG